MDNTIKMRATLLDDVTDVQALVQHPMDSGFGKTPENDEIPAHYIEVLRFEYSGRTVFEADWGPMIARNPYVRFSFKGGERGGEIKAHWVDNLGISGSTVEKIQ
jgi:sulfur-oxidizing protein SoxZ